MDNYSPDQNDGFTGNIIYQWWCPKCQVDHYTPSCPIEEYERLANSWKEMSYEFCPHCGQLIKKEQGIG